VFICGQFLQQNIRWLEVAVNHAVRVRVLHGFGERGH
jgi:hypothetical protein